MKAQNVRLVLNDAADVAEDQMTPVMKWVQGRFPKVQFQSSPSQSELRFIIPGRTSSEEYVVYEMQHPEEGSSSSSSVNNSPTVPNSSSHHSSNPEFDATCNVLTSCVSELELSSFTVYQLGRDRSYDMARKELYALRHQAEIEQRVQREEALSTGAYFGKSVNEISMGLEDNIYEEWKVWALKQAEALELAAGAAYTGVDEDSAQLDPADPETQEGLDEVGDSVPATREGQDAYGGAAVRP